MSPEHINAGDTSPGILIHFSTKFPVEKTACGTLGPAAALWRYVTCPGCLDVAPRDPRIEERRRALGLPVRSLDRVDSLFLRPIE